MSFWTRYNEPERDDYVTEEAYQDALSAYEDAEFIATEEARERYYEEKYGGFSY